MANTGTIHDIVSAIGGQGASGYINSSTRQAANSIQTDVQRRANSLLSQVQAESEIALRKKNIKEAATLKSAGIPETTDDEELNTIVEKVIADHANAQSELKKILENITGAM